MVSPKVIRKQDSYRLYKVGNLYELWHGTYNTEKYGNEEGVRVGYVSDTKNFEWAIEQAKENLRYLMENYS